MEKERIEIEHQLNSTSKTIIWRLISTAEGLAKWIADSVSLDGDQLTFGWGDATRHHEVRSATLLASSRFNSVRWRWNDEDDGSFVEIRMVPDTLTGLYALHITDFTDDDDKDWLYSAWSHNFDRMYRSSGV